MTFDNNSEIIADARLKEIEDFLGCKRSGIKWGKCRAHARSATLRIARKNAGKIFWTASSPDYKQGYDDEDDTHKEYKCQGKIMVVTEEDSNKYNSSHQQLLEELPSIIK